MDPHEAAAKLERLRAELEAVESLHAQAEQSRKDFRHNIDDMQEQITQAIQTCQRTAKRRRIGLPVAPPATPPKDMFTVALGEPSVPVHVGEATLHVHRRVLRSIPRFAAQMEGPWVDSDCIHIDLPCNVAEFCILLKRICTGELLGSPRLPVENCAVALRLCSAASMLMIDDQLPELPSLILSSVVTAEDASMALCAMDFLPVSVAKSLESLSDMPAPTSSDIQKMISASSTNQARDATSQILHAHRVHLDQAAIAKVAKEVVTKWRYDGKLDERIDWSIRLARDHLCCETATSIFALIGTSFCNACNAQRVKKVLAEFLAHLLRCAKSHILSQAICLGKGSFTSTCLCCGKNCNVRSILSIGQEEADAFAKVIAAAPHERDEVAAQLTKFPQLVDVLSDPMVVALGASFETIIEHLISNPYSAAKWFTKERLLRLSMIRRQAVSIVLLRDATQYLSPEVAKTVASTLA